MVRVCFVCLGNICRSPTGEGVMRHLLEEAGLASAVQVESAGTSGWHIGERPDARARAAAASRGIVVDGGAARFTTEDFHRFDFVLAMDGRNLSDLRSISPDDEASTKLHLLRDFDPQSPPGSDVPDPYYGAARGFEEVLDLCEQACRGFLAHLQASGALAR